MNLKERTSVNIKFSFASIALSILTFVSQASGQGTAFTYQGQLQNNGSLASGVYNFTFTLFSTNTGGTPVAGPLTNSAVAVSNGLFTVVMDFGSDVWSNTSNWLQIGVETNGASSFSTLTPRQQLTPVPYAITAENLDGTVGSGELSGTYSNPLTFSNAANQFTGGFIGNGSGLTNVNAVSLGGLPAASFWQLGGNVTVPSGSNVLGPLGNQYLDLRANGVRALRLRLFTDALGVYTNAPNVIGGSSVNLTAPNVVGATIAGGGGNGTNGSSLFNEVYADFGTIGGGANNSAGGLGTTVSGGIGNLATNAYAMVAGGVSNSVIGVGSFIGGGGYDGTLFGGNSIADAAGFIGGGVGNTIFSGASFAMIGGGYYNSCSAVAATLGGGNFNTAGGYAIVGGGSINNANGLVSAICGGYANTNNGVCSFIGGGGWDGSTLAGNLINATTAAIGGGLGNSIPSGGTYAVIGGGAYNIASGYLSSVAGGYGNTAEAPGSFIGGGGYDGTNYVGNFINSKAATIAGGLGNRIPGGAEYGAICGGIFNTNDGHGSFIGGGGYDGFSVVGNVIQDSAATIGGGIANSIPIGGLYAFIGGGAQNTASGAFATVGGGGDATASGEYSTVPGGYYNVAQGQASFAAGYSARALHDYSFVWSDGTVYPSFDSTARSQFLVYAAGGVGIGTNQPQAELHVAGSGGSSFPQEQLDQLNPSDYSRLRFTVNGNVNKRWDVGATMTNFVIYSGSIGANMVYLDSSGLTVRGTFVSSSDRSAKQQFQPIDSRQTLEKVTALPITTWSFKDDPATRHLGPMAQDFYAAFNIGPDDKHIATVDEGGVALAAIQGLNQKLEDRIQNSVVTGQKSETRMQTLEAENTRLQAQVVDLRSQLKALQKAVAQLAAKSAGSLP